MKKLLKTSIGDMRVIYKLMTIYDSKAKLHRAPMHFMNIETAKRAWADIANDMDSEIGMHPEDFSLMEVGEFSSETGEITPCTPINHGLAAQFQKGKEDPQLQAVN